MADKKCIVGTCLSMCPIEEMKFRQRNGLLHYFEKDHSYKSEVRALKGKTVKEFSRSAAGKKQLSAEDLRPSHILLKTVHYLMNDVLPQTVVPWLSAYDFVNDRLQAVRQDLTIQMIEDDNSVQIFEKCVRFYITASYILCEEPQIKFDQYLNGVQLSICLEKLFILYKKIKSKNLLEFIAIYYSQNVLSNENFYRSTLVFSEYFSNNLIKLSISICMAYLTGNFIKIFKLMRRLPLIVLLSYLPLFSKIRNQALSVLSTAYSSNTCKVPIGTICSWLCIVEEHDLIPYLQDCNVKLEDGNACFVKKSFKPAHFVIRKEGFIEKKMKTITVKNLINGIGYTSEV